MVERSIHDLLALDRDVARAFASLKRWRTILDLDTRAQEDPFEELRHVSGKSTWQALRDLTPSGRDEPLRDALSRWVAALIQQRVGLPDEIAWARETGAARGHFEGEPPRRVSWQDAWRGLVGANDPREGRLWLRAAADAAGPMPSLGRRRAERRREVARRLGFAHPWQLVVPVSPAALRSAAERLLSSTDELARSVSRKAIETASEEGAALAAATIHTAVGRDAAAGWPARLTGRWLQEIFAPGVHGLTLELPALPAPRGAASFARALRTFGHAWRLSIADPGQPFAVANDPTFVGGHRLGWVFGSLALEPEFHLRALRVGRPVARDHARVLARTALLEARLQSTRVLLGDEEHFAPSDRFEELTVRLFGRSLDARLCGAWPRAREDEPARLLGLLGAPAVHLLLRERFDVDWFRNPRAWTDLRAEGSRPAYETVDESTLEPSASRLARDLEEMLA